MRMQITFKSGAQIEVDVDEVTTGRAPFSRLSSMEWVTPENWTSKLQTFNVDEVVAVVLKRTRPLDMTERPILYPYANDGCTHGADCPVHPEIQGLHGPQPRRLS